MNFPLKSFLALFFCCLASVAFASDIAVADKLYEQGRIKEALQIYLQPKYREDSYIQNRIGNVYLKPDFRDEKKAVEWFRKSANQGNLHGQYNLGQMYKQGRGVNRDYRLAHQWLSKAAEQGNPRAMATLGNMYDEGTGVDKDELKAVNWYVKAAEKGNPDGQCNAAGLYTHGRAIRKDYDKARVLLEDCLKGNSRDDCCLDRLADLYSRGWGVKKDREKAHALREKAAANGSEVAMYMLGRDFDYGIGVEKDPEAALSWYLQSAAKGEGYAMYRLYEVYEYGKLGQAADREKAAGWKAKAGSAMKAQGLSRNVLMDRMRLLMEEEP